MLLWPEGQQEAFVAYAKFDSGSNRIITLMSTENHLSKTFDRVDVTPPKSLASLVFAIWTGLQIGEDGSEILLDEHEVSERWSELSATNAQWLNELSVGSGSQLRRGPPSTDRENSVHDAGRINQLQTSSDGP